MRRILFEVAALTALVGGFAATAETRGPEPPPPPWVDPATGFMKPGNWTAGVLDTLGNVVTDCNGVPIQIPVGQPPPPGPSTATGAGTPRDLGLPEWVPTTLVGGTVNSGGVEVSDGGVAVDGVALPLVKATIC